MVKLINLKSSIWVSVERSTILGLEGRKIYDFEIDISTILGLERRSLILGLWISPFFYNLNKEKKEAITIVAWKVALFVWLEEWRALEQVDDVVVDSQKSMMGGFSCLSLLATSLWGIHRRWGGASEVKEWD